MLLKCLRELVLEAANAPFDKKRKTLALRISSAQGDI
jgi:hypothetical protein